MGDRGQVRFINEEGEVWFYTHWGASDLVADVQAGLRRGRDRWDDSEYLARILFCELVGADTVGVTGYGIGLSRHSDVWQVVTVDAVEQTVLVESPPVGPFSFESFAEGGVQMLAEVGETDG